MFLNEDELRELTGYQLPSAQRRWLTKRSWNFEVSAFGKPKVLKAYAEQRMGMVTTNSPVPKAQPDFSRWTHNRNGWTSSNR